MVLLRRAFLMPLILALLTAITGQQALAASARPRPAPGGRFNHPGVLENRDQLALMRQQVTAGAQPWKSAFVEMRSSRYGSLAYQTHPRANVQCPFDAKPGHGCTEEREDAIAAYTQALLWNATGKRAHAEKAMQIMDAWSGKLKKHTDDNAPLQTAWAGASWAKAGELIKYTYPRWPKQRRFDRMLRDIYLPMVQRKAPQNGNWDLAMTDAAIGIAVFLDDREAFDKAVSRFRARVPAYFYLASDGRQPVEPPDTGVHGRKQLVNFWFKQPRFVSGIAQETCRNFMHIGYAIAATSHIAETAWHQGVDLYGEQRDRLRAAMEFHAKYQNGAKAPKWLCGGKVTRNMGDDSEVGYHHLADRLGLPMPHTAKLIAKQRPAGTDDLFVSWETLTHASGR
ncbi:alginate lyase family protein [Streptomyces boninensis]|uniref:alginate lyase family protein n=1 Tax=Streptomyces boninensis TaxID=2039455 RepID=UPI003B228A86